MRGERGQATVEWLALVLLAALVLGAAAAGATRREDRHGLGEVLAGRILGGAGASAPAAVRPAPPAAAPHAPPGLARLAPPLSAPHPSAPHAPPPSRQAAAFQRLRGVGTVARHAWIICLGYRRWRYELEHPLAPTEPLPLADALEILNDCLNPYAFLTDE